MTTDERNAKVARRILAGESTAAVAADYGVTPQTIRKWVRDGGHEFPGSRGPTRHKLANVDREAMTADCAACGPVPIRGKKDGKVQCRPGGYRVGSTRKPPPPGSAVAYGPAGSLRLMVSPEARATILEKCGGACCICERPLTVETMRADHDHTSGAVRGALCQRCNTGLGKFKDDANLLRRAVAYLVAAQSRESLVDLVGRSA